MQADGGLLIKVFMLNEKKTRNWRLVLLGHKVSVEFDLLGKCL